jgi:hypothetical protein
MSQVDSNMYTKNLWYDLYAVISVCAILNAT